MKNDEFIKWMEGNKGLDSRGHMILEHMSTLMGLNISFEELYKRLDFIRNETEKTFVMDCITSNRKMHSILDMLDLYLYFGLENYVREVTNNIVKKVRFDDLDMYLDYFDLNSRKWFTALQRYNRLSREFLTCRYFSVKICPEIEKNLFTCPFTNAQDVDISSLAFSRKSIVIRIAHDEDHYIARLEGDNVWRVATESDLNYFDAEDHIKCELPNFETPDGKWLAMSRYSRI